MDVRVAVNLESVLKAIQIWIMYFWTVLPKDVFGYTPKAISKVWTFVWVWKKY